MKALPLGRLVLASMLAAMVCAVAMAADPPAEDRSSQGDAKPAAEKTSSKKPSSDKPAMAKPVPMSKRPETIEKFAQYYLDMYGLHLKSHDWMARAMGVISLARLDDPRATALLMPVSSRKQLFNLPDDLATKIDIQFYLDSKEALVKSLAD